VGANHGEAAGEFPEFGVGTQMQIVPHIFIKYCSELTKTRHFKAKVYFIFLGRAFSLSERAFPLP